jgi:transcriptional regulator with XRE-family HTH domain
MEPWPDRLARLRHAAGLTQAQVADHFGIKPSSVAQWEGTGGRITRPSIDKLPKLARLYGVELDILCGSDFPLPAAMRAGRPSSVLALSEGYPPPSQEEIENLLKDPEMWTWVSIIRLIEKEDRALLSEMLLRWVVRSSTVKKA